MEVSAFIDDVVFDTFVVEICCSVVVVCFVDSSSFGVVGSVVVVVSLTVDFDDAISIVVVSDVISSNIALSLDGEVLDFSLVDVVNPSVKVVFSIILDVVNSFSIVVSNDVSFLVEVSVFCDVVVSTFLSVVVVMPFPVVVVYGVDSSSFVDVGSVAADTFVVVCFFVVDNVIFSIVDS